MKYISSIIKAFIVSFSIYSKVPMPRFNWDSEDMKYHFVFFPWIGLLIGILQYVFMRVGLAIQCNCVIFGMVSMMIILLVTGGIHLDGYMDTCDALNSYQSKEKKLEILKDPHIGAFSVICLIGLVLSYVSAAAMIFDKKMLDGWLIICLYFAVSRCIGGLAVLSFLPAKSDGMAKSEAENSNKKIVKIILYIELILLFGFMCLISIETSLIIFATQMIFLFAYKGIVNKQFGGITGDLAGYYISLSETLAVIAAAISGLVII